MIKLNVIIYYQNTMYNCECIINYSPDFLDENRNRFEELINELFQKTSKNCVPNVKTFPISLLFTNNEEEFKLTITKTQSIMAWNEIFFSAGFSKKDFTGTVKNYACSGGSNSYIKFTIDNIEDIFYHVNKYSGIKVGSKSIDLSDFANLDRVALTKLMINAKRSGDNELYEQLRAFILTNRF